MKEKNLDWKIKITSEIILFITYLGTGMMVGWMFALGGTSLEKIASTLSMSVAFIPLWALHRWRNSMFFNIRTPIDGAIAGTLFAALPMYNRIHPQCDKPASLTDTDGTPVRVFLYHTAHA